MDLDILIKNGSIYDGLGNPPARGSLGIADGRIVFPVDEEASHRAREVIDGEGMAVAPGFINIHSHSEIAFLVDPRVPSTLLQGITTEVAGNCGFSLAPLAGEYLEETRRDLQREYGMDVTWSDFRGLFRLINEKCPAVNVMSLAGHGAIRGSVMGMSDRPPSRNDLAGMKEALALAMRQGAAGFSTGLIYPPGVYSQTDELVELASTAHLHGGFYSSHIRGEGETLFDAIREAIEIGRQTGIPVEISHLKAATQKNWGRVQEALDMIHEARDRGMFIQHDQYPYTASATGLSMILPDWAHDGGVGALLARLADPPARARIRKEMEDIYYSNGDTIIIAGVGKEKNRNLEGRKVDEIAGEMGVPVLDFLLDLLTEEEASVDAIFLSMREDDVQKVLLDPYTAICNDASAKATDGPLFKGKPHPRTYGSFPRVLGHYCRDEAILPLEEGVRKMTSLPARMLGLRDRGIIGSGYAADLVLFDPTKIADAASYADPHRYPEGIRLVIVNGRVAARDGLIQEGRHGRVLGCPQEELAKTV
jgi:N-acyl-D-amino-acid deacylase